MIIKDNQITFTSYFGKKKSFTFGYITTVKHRIGKGNYKGIEYMTAYHEKEKLFSFSSICPGFQVLFQRLKNEDMGELVLNNIWKRIFWFYLPVYCLSTQTPLFFIAAQIRSTLKAVRPDKDAQASKFKILTKNPKGKKNLHFSQKSLRLKLKRFPA